MVVCRLALASSVVVCLAVGLRAVTPEYMPLGEIRPGMRGVGKTVFQGDRIDDFGVEILGVLENVGPKQSIILARLAGGPLDKNGVLQGMSGSPVYINGRLAGAVALAFPFSKEPIAGIRPIEEMLRGGDARMPRKTNVRASLKDGSLTERLPKPEPASGGRLIEIATPVSFTGFPSTTIDQFAPQLRALGLEPVQGLSGGSSRNAPPPATPLQPG
ncbi:MAG TPA: SpoIVB peptidase S55 domain-containing protein, partial [Bryobacteraceae bacterium]|nr:SpoIVB peptidase S55 domain-containing protein [Bryobacteraceae bacterium]